MKRTMAVILAGLLLPSCGEPDVKPITDVRERQARGPAVPTDVDAATRLGLGRDPHAGIPGFGGMGATPGGMQGATRIPFTFATPAGWRALPPGIGRDAGFVAGPDGAVRITLSRAGGDLLANVNRWRGQMGQAPITQEAVEALPTREVLGTSAVRVEIEGSYTSMRGTKTAAATMLGLVVPRPGQSVFVKMVGPTAAVKAERERFEAFATSIEAAAAPSMHTGHPPVAGHPPVPGHPPAGGSSRAPDPAAIAWDVPEGWTASAATPPRLGTFKPKDATQAECLVTVLRGSGGGVAANMNEWRRQMGQAKLTPNEYTALQRIPVLGVDAVYIKVEGDYKGKSGEDETDAILYGLIAPREHDTVFVKMWGPASELEGEEERFLAFCRSLRE